MTDQRLWNNQGSAVMVTLGPGSVWNQGLCGTRVCEGPGSVWDQGLCVTRVCVHGPVQRSHLLPTEDLTPPQGVTLVTLVTLVLGFQKELRSRLVGAGGGHDGREKVCVP